MKLIEVHKIWDGGPHNAFTDLARFENRWYCVFREGEGHGSSDGAVRVISSADAAEWESEALIRMTPKRLRALEPKVLPDEEGYMDLRDPKLCITPDGRLMLTAGLRYNADGEDMQSLAWFSEDGSIWGTPALIGENQYWLWRVTWHVGVAYAVGRVPDERIPRLYRSTDGRHFEVLLKDAAFFPHVPGPSEATLRFRDDNTALCLIRLNNVPGSMTDHGHLGTARPPYTNWTWQDLGAKVGGPNMLELPDGRFVAAVRLYDNRQRTALCWLDPKTGTLTEALTLPSGGDTSYAGLVSHDGVLWVSYYSSHEDKTSIYLAKVRIDSE